MELIYELLVADRTKYMRAAPGGKRTKESVNYSKGNMAEHCGICRHYQEPNACELVEGHIVPSYWCRLFEKSRMTATGALRGK